MLTKSSKVLIESELGQNTFLKKIGVSAEKSFYYKTKTDIWRKQ